MGRGRNSVYSIPESKYNDAVSSMTHNTSTQRWRTFRSGAALFLTVVCTTVKAATITHTCKFTSVASPTEVKQLAESFNIKYLSDTLTQKSYMVGNAGVEQVSVVPNDGGISFVEITGSGNVQVTTIAKSGSAVHSRNTILSQKTLVATQYYGTCTIE